MQIAAGDKLLVWGTDMQGHKFYGELELQSGSGSTSGKFSGTLIVVGGSGDPLVAPKSVYAILAPSDWSTKGYTFDGTNYCYKHSTYTPVSSMTAIGPYLPIQKVSYDSAQKKFTLEPKGCIIHVVWSGMKASQNYTIHTYDKSGDGKVDYCGGSMTSDETGKLDFYIPSTLSNGYYFVLNGEKEYTYDLTGTTTAITGQKIYRLKRTFLTNLSAQYTASNGDRFIGSTAYGIKIPAGATITLENASVSQTATNLTYPAVLCEGSATINLVGTNTLTSNTTNYSGIQPGGTNKTLTIQGSGNLTVTGGRSAAGIGAGGGTTCGNITIAGGTITATGGSGGAGIGSGSMVNTVASQCGDILISGGTVTGIGTGEVSGAGIGTGYNSICGAITIGEDVSYVEMRRQVNTSGYEGDGCYYILGRADVSCTCGKITIDGTDMSTPGIGMPILYKYTHYASSYDSDSHLWWTLTKKTN